MRYLKISLQETMFQELEQAAGEIHEMGYGPEMFASECIESVLASRRISRVYTPPLSQGAQMCGTRGVSEPEAGLVEHRVLIPADTLEML